MKTRVLSLLIALAILVTVGGVYATWLYAETDMTAVHGHIGSFGLASAEINNSKGTFTVDASSAHLVIDQTAADNYVAKLTATGTITVKFTPSTIFGNSHPDQETFDVVYSLVTDNPAPTSYKANDGTGEKALFTKFDTTTLTDLTLRKDGDIYTATVDANALLNLIELNTFELDTYAEYSNFSAQVGIFGNIGFQIAEAE